MPNNDDDDDCDWPVLMELGKRISAAHVAYSINTVVALSIVLMSAAAPTGTTDGHLQIHLVNGNHWLVSSYDVATQCVTVYDSVYTHAGVYRDLDRQLQYCYHQQVALVRSM